MPSAAVAPLRGDSNEVASGFRRLFLEASDASALVEELVVLAPAPSVAVGIWLPVACFDGDGMDLPLVDGSKVLELIEGYLFLRFFDTFREPPAFCLKSSRPRGKVS